MNSFAIVLAIFGIVDQSVFIVVEHRKRYVLSVILKGTASVLFCAIGAIALCMAAMNQSFARITAMLSSDGCRLNKWQT